MSGVIDISLRQPPESMEAELGLSFFNTRRYRAVGPAATTAAIGCSPAAARTWT